MRGQKLQTSPFFFCIRKTKRENKVLNVTMRLEDDKAPVAQRLALRGKSNVSSLTGVNPYRRVRSG